MAYSTVSQTVDAYDSMLNDAYGTVAVAGQEFDTSRALELLDPLAYKSGWGDWCDAEGIDTDDLFDDYEFEWDK